MAATTTTTANNATRASTAQAKTTADEATQRLEEGSERIRQFNSAVMDTSKAGSRVVLDSYSQTAHHVFALQRQMVSASQVQWVRDVAATQIQFAEDVTHAWIRAVRELMK